MLLGRYLLACGFHDDAELPPFKGSTFRGAFGWALKRVVCALKTQQCAKCILRDRCVYCLAFETLPPDGTAAVLRLPILLSSSHPSPSRLFSLASLPSQ